MALRRDLDPRFGSFDEYFQAYLAERRHPWTRRVQFLGTSLAVGMVAGSFIGAAAASLGPAWLGHRLFERKRPRTPRSVAWRLRADLLLWTEMLQELLGGPDKRKTRPLVVVDTVASSMAAVWPDALRAEPSNDSEPEPGSSAEMPRRASQPSATATSDASTPAESRPRARASSGWAMWQ